MKKNILFILPDQMRADYLGCYGASFAKTPNIDKLAGEGVKYNSCISPSPLCVPARASLLTGQNAIANGVVHNSVWLRPDREACGMQTWPEILSSNGYKTIGVGKMHFYPWDIMEGFDERIISEDKRHIYVEDDYDVDLKANGLKKFHGNECEGYFESKGSIVNPLPKEFQADRWIADKACDFIKNYDDEKPFAMMVGLVSPHCPYDPDIEDLNLFSIDDMPEPIAENDESNSFKDILIPNYKHAWCGIDYSDFTVAQKKKMKQHYSALIHKIDECVGSLVETLKEKGIYDDTVIIFASDHGDFVGDYGYVGKHLFYTPSIGVPLIVRDNSLTPAEVEELVSLTDVRATMLHIAGIEDTDTTDSKCLSCYKEVAPNRGVMGATDLGLLYCTDDYKLCKYENGQVHLFDRKNDPMEDNNLANNPEYMHVMRELEQRLQHEVIHSVVRANTEKTVDHTTSLNPDDFFKRNWQRPYPTK